MNSKKDQVDCQQSGAVDLLQPCHQTLQNKSQHQGSQHWRHH